MSVRERIRAIQTLLRDSEMTPDSARTFLVQLTALWGHCNDEVRASDVDYKKVLLQAFNEEKTANRARLVAETKPEYARFREARDTQEQVKQMIVTCRAFLRSLDEEMRLGSR